MIGPPLNGIRIGTTYSHPSSRIFSIKSIQSIQSSLENLQLRFLDIRKGCLDYNRHQFLKLGSLKFPQSQTRLFQIHKSLFQIQRHPKSINMNQLFIDHLKHLNEPLSTQFLMLSKSLENIQHMHSKHIQDTVPEVFNISQEKSIQGPLLKSKENSRSSTESDSSASFWKSSREALKSFMTPQVIIETRKQTYISSLMASPDASASVGIGGEQYNIFDSVSKQVVQQEVSASYRKDQLKLHRTIPEITSKALPFVERENNITNFLSHAFLSFCHFFNSSDYPSTFVYSGGIGIGKTRFALEVLGQSQKYFKFHGRDLCVSIFDENPDFVELYPHFSNSMSIRNSHYILVDAIPVLETILKNISDTNLVDIDECDAVVRLLHGFCFPHLELSHFAQQFADTMTHLDIEDLLDYLITLVTSNQPNSLSLSEIDQRIRNQDVVNLYARKQSKSNQNSKQYPFNLLRKIGNDRLVSSLTEKEIKLLPPIVAQQLSTSSNSLNTVFPLENEFITFLVHIDQLESLDTCFIRGLTKLRRFKKIFFLPIVTADGLTLDPSNVNPSTSMIFENLELLSPEASNEIFSNLSESLPQFERWTKTLEQRIAFENETLVEDGFEPIPFDPDHILPPHETFTEQQAALFQAFKTVHSSRNSSTLKSKQSGSLDSFSSSSSSSSFIQQYPASLFLTLLSGGLPKNIQLIWDSIYDLETQRISWISELEPEFLLNSPPNQENSDANQLDKSIQVSNSFLPPSSQSRKRKLSLLPLQNIDWDLVSPTPIVPLGKAHIEPTAISFKQALLELIGLDTKAEQFHATDQFHGLAKRFFQNEEKNAMILLPPTLYQLQTIVQNTVLRSATMQQVILYGQEYRTNDPFYSWSKHPFDQQNTFSPLSLELVQDTRNRILKGIHPTWTHCRSDIDILETTPLTSLSAKYGWQVEIGSSWINQFWNRLSQGQGLHSWNFDANFISHVSQSIPKQEIPNENDFPVPSPFKSQEFQHFIESISLDPEATHQFTLQIFQYLFNNNQIDIFKRLINDSSVLMSQETTWTRDFEQKTVRHGIEYFQTLFESSDSWSIQVQADSLDQKNDEIKSFQKSNDNKLVVIHIKTKKPVFQILFNFSLENLNVSSVQDIWGVDCYEKYTMPTMFVSWCKKPHFFSENRKLIPPHHIYVFGESLARMCGGSFGPYLSLLLQ